MHGVVSGEVLEISWDGGVVSSLDSLLLDGVVASVLLGVPGSGGGLSPPVVFMYQKILLGMVVDSFLSGRGVLGWPFSSWTCFHPKWWWPFFPVSGVAASFHFGFSLLGVVIFFFEVQSNEVNENSWGGGGVSLLGDVGGGGGFSSLYAVWCRCSLQVASFPFHGVVVVALLAAFFF